MQNLEQEIEDSTKRIKKRENEIGNELDLLKSKIDIFNRWGWRFVWFGALIGIFSICYYLFNIPTNDNFGLNYLGDFLAGSVASIWSLAGLFFIYVAFLGQKQQLLNQQLELMYSQLEVKYTRLELAGQKIELKNQNLTLQKQRFENTFFQLLNLFNSNVEAIDLRDKESRKINSTGRDCFKVFHNYLEKYTKQDLFGNHNSNKKIDNVSVEELNKAYYKLYESYKSDLSHYFRTLYHIIKFVDSSDIENKKQYISVTRAQLSSHEQAILFYNCLHPHGIEKFKPLIEKYALFKNLDRELIFNLDHLESYKDSAYGF